MALQLFRTINLINLVIKFSMLLIFRYIDYEQSIKEIPFFMTKFQDYSRVEEAHYMIDKGFDPYIIDFIFQKPILVYILYYLRNYQILIMSLYVFADLIIAEVISSRYFVHSLTCNEEEINRSQRIFHFVYLFNPLFLFALATKWTSIFDICAGLFSVYLLAQNSSAILVSLLFGLAIYLNPINLMLIIPMGAMCAYKDTKINQKVIQKVIIFSVVVVAALLYFSFCLTGSWNFMKQCYYKAYFPKLFQPSIGLIWALFSGMFNRYQMFYHGTMMIMPLSFIYPLIKIFQKAIKEYEWKEGLIGFMAGISIFIGYCYFSFITIYELVFAVLIFMTGYEYVFRVDILIVIAFAAIFMTGLTSCLTGLWWYSLTGNPNFCFFQTVVIYVFIVAFFTESIKQLAFSKKKELLQQNGEKNKQELNRQQINTLSKENKDSQQEKVFEGIQQQQHQPQNQPIDQ